MVKFHPLLFLLVYGFTAGTIAVMHSIGWVKNPINSLLIVELGIFLIFVGPFTILNIFASKLGNNLGISFIALTVLQFILGALWFILINQIQFLTIYKGTVLIFTGSYFSYFLIEVILVLLLVKRNSNLLEK
jgi:hypothetical protein